VRILNEALGLLKQRVAALGLRARIVAAIVNGVGTASVDDLKSCKVAEVQTGFTVEPASLTFTAGADASKSIVISGGKAPYFAEPLDDPMEGLTVRSLGLESTRVEVVAKKPPAGGPYTILVRDLTNQRRRVTVTVVPAATRGSSAPGAAPSRGAVNGTAVALDDTQRARIRAVLCVPKDTPWDGPVMTDAISIYRQKVTSGAADVTGPLGKEEADHLLSLRDCPPDRKNFVERDLTPGQVKNIQGKIGMLAAAQTGVFDPSTRSALRAFRRKIGLGDDDQLRVGDEDKILRSATPRPPS
jgi:hypothetical protein